MSGPFIGYPTGWILGVIDDPSDAVEGRAVVGVRPNDAARAAAAIGVLKRHGAHFINRFGAWSTEKVLPWRGPMPEIPQLMRR